MSLSFGDHLGRSGACATFAAVLVLLGCSGGGSPQIDTQEAIRELIDWGSYADAEQRARRLLARVEESAGPEEPATADALDLLVESLWRTGKAREPATLELARRAVRIREQRLDASDIALVPGLTNLGTVYRRSGDVEASEEALDRALRIVNEAAGPDDVRIAPIVTQIGILRLSSGDADAARESLEHAIAIVERGRGRDDPSLADPLRALGVLHRRMGAYDTAAAIYERLLDLEQRHLAENSPDRARSLNSYAALLQNTGDYAGARLRFEQALAIRRETLEADHLDIGSNLNNLAIVLGDIGDHAAASRHYGEALVILEKQLGSDHPYVASVLNNQANSLRELGEYQSALPLFERALAIREATLDADDPDVAQSLANLAILFTDMGDYAAARPLYERALPIWKASLGPEHPEVTECINALADLLARMGETERAQVMFREALAIRERTGGADHPLVAETLADAARAALEAGDVDSALDLALRALDIRREHVRLTSQTLSEREALGYAESRIPALDIALAVAARDGRPDRTAARVWDGVIRSRALVLDEMALRNRDLGEAGDAEIARQVDQLRSVRARLAELWVRGGDEFEPEEYRGLLEQAHRDKEQAEIALARKSLDFRRQRARAGSGLEEVRGALPPDAALVAYVRGPDHYLAFVSSGSADVVISLGAVAEIEFAIEAWRKEILRAGEIGGRALREAESRYRETARQLRSLVWDPVLPHLADSHRVYLVADGALSLVSFVSLPNEEGGYLIEGGRTLHHLVTERDLLPPDGRSDPGLGLLALGGPAYDGRGDRSPETVAAFRGTRSACGALQSLEFSPLPETEREVREIAETWNRLGQEQRASGTARVLTLDEATEEAFKALGPRARVVHLATHGFFLGGECAADEEPAKEDVSRENPLLLSGLALAGANLRRDAGPDEEDGILTAEEIAAMDLNGTEWVVLSACDTGLGRVRPGEDVFGLRRAFQIAGAEKIVMSLWAVDDRASRSWMAAFYDVAFATPASAANAPARQAGLRVLEQRRRQGQSTHPYFWAAFVACGSP